MFQTKQEQGDQESRRGYDDGRDGDPGVRAVATFLGFANGDDAYAKNFRQGEADRLRYGSRRNSSQAPAAQSVDAGTKSVADAATPSSGASFSGGGSYGSASSGFARGGYLGGFFNILVLAGIIFIGFLSLERQTSEPPRAPAQRGQQPLTPARVETIAPAQPGLRGPETAIAEVQRSLNRHGCNAGTVDGVIGPRTLRAARHFGEATGRSFSQADLAHSSTAALIARQSGPACATRWILAHHPAAIAGNWTYSAECPPETGLGILKGTMSFRQVSAVRFEGEIENSAGQRGRIAAEIGGGEVRTGMHWQTGHVTHARAAASDAAFAFSGADSLGCRVTAWKN